MLNLIFFLYLIHLLSILEDITILENFYTHNPNVVKTNDEGLEILNRIFPQE